MELKIAVMQPAFIPPASYFRLFAVADLFVILDDVQFNRRWYTHRQKLTKYDGKKDWLTLPIKRTDRDTTMIKDLEWSDDSKKKWVKQMARFFGLSEKSFFPLAESPVNFLVRELQRYCEILKIEFKIVYASSLHIPSGFRGESRVIEICKRLGAIEYINSHGGKNLYDEKSFAKEGIKLTFLPDYKGSMDSIMERLTKENTEDIKREILENL